MAKLNEFNDELNEDWEGIPYSVKRSIFIEFLKSRYSEDGPESESAVDAFLKLSDEEQRLIISKCFLPDISEVARIEVKLPDDEILKESFENYISGFLKGIYRDIAFHKLLTSKKLYNGERRMRIKGYEKFCDIINALRYVESLTSTVEFEDFRPIYFDEEEEES